MIFQKGGGGFANRQGSNQSVHVHTLHVGRISKHYAEFVCLFDLILYVHSTIFQLCGTNLPGLNQY